MPAKEIGSEFKDCCDYDHPTRSTVSGDLPPNHVPHTDIGFHPFDGSFNLVPKAIAFLMAFQLLSSLKSSGRSRRSAARRPGGFACLQRQPTDCEWISKPAGTGTIGKQPGS